MKLIHLSRTYELVATYDEWQDYQENKVGVDDLFDGFSAIFGNDKEKTNI